MTFSPNARVADLQPQHSHCAGPRGQQKMFGEFLVEVGILKSRILPVIGYLTLPASSPR